MAFFRIYPQCRIPCTGRGRINCLFGRDPVVRLSRAVLRTFQSCHLRTRAYGAHAVIFRRAATARKPRLLPAPGYPRQRGREF